MIIVGTLAMQAGVVNVGLAQSSQSLSDFWVPVVVAVIWAGSWLAAQVRQHRKKNAESPTTPERGTGGDDFVEVEELEELPDEPARATAARVHPLSRPTPPQTSASSSPPPAQPAAPAPGSWQQLLADPGAWVEEMQAAAEKPQTGKAPRDPSGPAGARGQAGSSRPTPRPRQPVPQARPGATASGPRPVRPQSGASGSAPRPGSGQRPQARPPAPPRPAPPAAPQPVAVHDVSEGEIGAVDAFAPGTAGQRSRDGAVGSALGLIDRGALRRAVLMAEVLAPPLALREPAQQPGAAT